MKEYLKKCSICSSDFYTNNYRVRICSDKCRAQGRVNAWKRSDLFRNKGILGSDRECAVCKSIFTVKIHNAKYCSKKCKNKNRKIKTMERYYSDLDYKIRHNLRSRLRKAIKYNREVSAISNLGCDLKSLKKHLESKFEEGMSWDNYGKWHIDHIVPLSKFNLTNKEEALKACHYSNLQPLWAKDNLKKSNKIEV